MAIHIYEIDFEYFRKICVGMATYSSLRNSFKKYMYRISANSFRGNYSFLNLSLCTVTFDHSTYRCGNYSREETIQGRKLFAEIRYVSKRVILVLILLNICSKFICSYSMFWCRIYFLYN